MRTGAAAPDVFRNPEALAFPLSDLDHFGARWWAYFVPPVDNAWLGQVAAMAAMLNFMLRR